MDQNNASRPRRMARREANTVPAPTQQPPAIPQQEVPMQKPKVGLKAISEMLYKKKEAIARVIPDACKINADTLIQNALQMVMKDRKLLCCDPYSVLDSVLCAARLGFDLSADTCYLIPLEAKAKDDNGNRTTNHDHFYCALWPSYKGLLSVAARAGFYIDSQEVRENDTIMVQAGTENKINHSIKFGNRGNVVGVYCVVRDTAARVVRIETMDNEDLDQVRRNTSTWNDWYGEMARKSVAKRACKWLPRDNPDFRLVSEIEKRNDEGQELAALVPDTDTPTVTGEDLTN